MSTIPVFSKVRAYIRARNTTSTSTRDPSGPILVESVLHADTDDGPTHSEVPPRAVSAPEPEVCEGPADSIVRPDVQLPALFSDILGASAALDAVLTVVERVAPTMASVLITGETGTGKDLIARALHTHSPRHTGPFVCINCPAIPATLAESELFGHERGAFTNATDARPGRFELAHRGTIFLDEVADLPLELQVKLLRIVQDHETQRIGSRIVRKLDFRVVAATNRDLTAAMRSGEFREDLYYRLATVHVHLPPLRERPEDIPLLASFFCARAEATYQKAIRGFTSAAMSALRRHSWPGNVRELQHVIERAVLLCSEDVIGAEHLRDLAHHPRASAVATAAHGSPPIVAHHSLGAALQNEKRRRITQALASTRGNQAAAARLLGISRSNLCRLLKRLDIRVEGLRT